jgi:hypothetical protein
VVLRSGSVTLLSLPAPSQAAVVSLLFGWVVDMKAPVPAAAELNTEESR